MAEEYLHQTVNKVEAMEKCIMAGYVDFNMDNYKDENNFFVNNPAGVLRLLTGRKWSVTKENPTYRLKKGEYAIEYWFKAPYGHFARTYRKFNSLQNSNCVNNGVIQSYRIARLSD